MPNVVSETAHLLLVTVIFVLILVTGRAHGLREERGWRFIIAGCGLIVLGSAFEITDHIFSWDLSLIFGDAKIGGVLENIVGHILGFTLIFFGLWSWLPSIGALRSEEQRLAQRTIALESEIAERVTDLRRTNDELTTELAQRERTEQTLAHNTERFRDFASAGSDFFWEMDENLRFSYFSERFKDLSGVSPSDLLGKTRRDLLEDNDPVTDEITTPEVWQQHVSDLENHMPFRNFVHPRRHEDGYVRYLSISGKPVFDKKGNFRGYRGAGSDVTQRRRTQDVLQQLEERLSAFVDNSPNAISLKKADGRYLLINPPYEKVIGATNDEVKGKTAHEIFTKDFADSGVVHDRLVLETRQVVEREETLHLESGERTWLTIKFPIFDAAKNITAIGAISTDITERKQIEHMKTEFISVVSHELRTPLTSIFGSLSVIHGGMLGELSEELEEMVGIAYRNADRLIRLINDILDIEKIEAGKMVFRNEPLDLCHLIEQSIEANRPYRGERRQHKRKAKFHGHDVNITFDTSLPGVKVYADPDRLTQVMNNLLSNAAKFSPPGGTVEVSVLRHHGLLRVAVSDRGPGIPAEARDQIFEKFFQVDNSDTRDKQGTGLGLSISHAIIEELGGSIGFDTENRAGTTFYFDLPEWQAIGVDNSRVTDTSNVERARLTAP